MLELQGISKSFGAHQVLKGISLGVRPGEFLTFLGPSGCGKTTTLRIIGGFETPDSGLVFLKGRDVTRWPAHRRDLHTVFQHYALFPHLDVFENVAFSLRLKGLPPEDIRGRVREALALVKLSGFESRRAPQLSGGQQQRVALARSLVGRPKLLLLDEPLGALDVKLRKQMQLELKGIQKETGIAFVYVTHDQEEALTLSDRIAVFNAGEIIQLGEPRAIYEAPGSSFVADFIGSANILEAVLAEATEGRLRLVLEGEWEVSVHRPQGFAARVGESVPVAIRPERIEVRFSEPLGSINGYCAFPADLRDVIYLGYSTQAILSPFSKSEKQITAAAPSMLEPRLKSGAPPKVWLYIHSKDILPLCPR